MIGFLFFLSLLVLSQSPILLRFTEASSLAICFWRLLIAAGLILPFVFRDRHAAKNARLDRGDYGRLALSGLFLFVHFYSFFKAVQETSIANSTILFSLNPVTTAVGAYFMFRERVTTHLVLSCALGFAGIAVLFGGSIAASSGGFQGDIWAILSAVSFSGYLLTGKHVRLKLPNSFFAAAVYFQTAVYSAIVMAALGVPFFGYSTTTWWMFLALAVLPTLMGHAIFSYCLNFLNVNFMSCATLVEPVMAAIVAAYLFKEPLTDLAAVGFLLTCFSVFALYWPSLRSWRRA
jgi:drug/metabolite transporter (DMT)-like permease